MRIQTCFDREAVQLDTEIAEFIRSAVIEMKAKAMQVFFVNQRNDDIQTTVTVTGLAAVDRPMVASMLDSGFRLIDTQHFGVESMAIEGFQPSAPDAIALALGTHAREEQLVLPEDLAPEDSTPAAEMLWPFDFSSAEELQAMLTGVFGTALSTEDAAALFQLQTLPMDREQMARYQQMLGKVAAHYASAPQDFVRDLMISPQGRWCFYRSTLSALKASFSVTDFETLLGDLREKALTADEIAALVHLLYVSGHPAQDQIAQQVQHCEQALQKLDTDFQPGDAPTAVLAFLKWYADLG